jgi:hypothetical protein
MKTIQAILLIIVLLIIRANSFGQTSAGSNLESFNKIEISGSSNVTVVTGNQQSIEIISGNPNDIRLRSSNGILKIDGAPSKLKITMPELAGVEISGIGTINIDSAITASTFRIDISGSGKVNFNANNDRLRINISGIGKMNAAGNTNILEANISGSGKIDAPDLTVKTADASISGVGKITADVTDELILNISGSGTFNYLNEPPKIKSNISGIGKYKAIEKESTKNDTSSVSSGNNKVVVITKEDKDFDMDFDDNEFMRIRVNTDDTQDTIFVKPRKAKSHWGGIDLGFNQLMYGKNFSTSIPAGFDYLDLNDGKSINVNINIFYHDFQLYKRYIMFTTGIGLTLNNYRFSTDKTLRADTNKLFADYDLNAANENINYEKNKLSVNYVTVPLILQFNSDLKARKSWHLAMGLLVHYKFSSHLKLVYNEEGSREKVKRRDDFNIDPLRADATIRLGYRSVTFYSSYALTELFKDGRGAPQLYPFTVGINLAGW